jgi:hypothetical protein
MIKSLAYFIAVAFLLCASQPAFCQTSEPSGTWGGALATDAGPGGLEITFSPPEADEATRRGRQFRTEWLSMKMRLEGQEATPTIREIQIKDQDVSLTFELGPNLVKLAGKFSGDKLEGTVEAFRENRKIGSGTFTLTRGGQMPPLQAAQSGQRADPDFNTRVAQPAYSANGPKVLFDEAHNNFHTASGRYKPFADLITSDGYQVVPNKDKFSPEVLKGASVLVISNALGARSMGEAAASGPAFTDAESDAVRDWVRGGGSLLLIADHAPMGAANQILGQRFGVDMSKMYTIDEQNFEKEAGNPGFIIYTRESGRLADHAITRGRNDGERINKIVTFTGQSLKGPADGVPFLKLADTAQDTMPGPNAKPISAAGRAQGIAMKFGKGRVIVMGEAGMLSAQLTGNPGVPFGMNRPGIDNRQLALNIMHWLSGVLK